MEKDPYYQNIFVVSGLSVCLAGGATAVAALSRRRPFSLAKVNDEFKSVNRAIILRLYKLRQFFHFIPTSNSVMYLET